MPYQTPQSPGAEPAAQGDDVLARLGALAAVVGVSLQLWLSGQHAGHVDPNHSEAVFREYAASASWTVVHIGQFIGTVLIVLGLLALATSLAGERGVARAMRSAASVALVVLLAVFAVQMAVDGVALREAIAAWISAPSEPERAAAFYVAENVRWLEKGLSAFFHLTNGTALTALGLAVALGRTYPKWIGFFGVASGVTAFAGGIATAHTGFSAQAGAVLGPSALAGIAFVAVASVAMWRRAGRTVESALAPAAA